MSGIRQRFDSVCERLERALAASGRKPGCVTLVAVSKNHEAAAVAELAGYWAAKGSPVFGESYAQEALPKIDEAAALAPGVPVRWHFVGHIQSRKARELVGRFELLHSVGSIKLAHALDKAFAGEMAEAPRALGAKAPKPQAVLAQVNVGREPQKSGVDPEELQPLLEAILTMPGLALHGLMCLPPLAEIGEHSRPYFAMLRELAANMEQKLGISLPQLSMGMSDDFEVAVAEGATLVRVGTDIFGPRVY